MIERNHAAFQKIRTFGESSNDQNDTHHSTHNSSGELTPNASEPRVTDETAQNLARRANGSQELNTTTVGQLSAPVSRVAEATPPSLVNYPEIKLLQVPSVKSGDWRTFGTVRCKIMLTPHANIEYIAKGTIWITTVCCFFLMNFCLIPYLTTIYDN